MRKASLAILSLAGLLAACGGSRSPEATDREQIEATAERFAAAVEGKDARAFCKLLAPEAKKRLRYEGRKCLVVWGRGENPLFRAEDPDLALAKLVSLERPNATAELTNGGKLVFLREDGTWYVNLAAPKEEAAR